MANHPALQPVARAGDDPTVRRLRELAAQEATATKQRLATRTTAARLFSGAVARLAESKATWERSQAEAQRAQAEALEDLLASGLEPGEVTELPGMSKKELRSLRAATRERPTEAIRPMNGSVALEKQSTHLATAYTPPLERPRAL
jgi:hypothetical protein